MSFELKLMDDASSLLSRSAIEAVDGEDEDSGFGGFDESGSEVSSVVFLDSEENRSGVSSILAVTSEDENWLPRQESEDGSLLLEGDPSDASSLYSDNVLGLEASSETGTPFGDVGLISNTSESLFVAVGDGNGEEIVDGSTSGSSMDVVPLKIGMDRRASRSIFEVSYIPLWGFASMLGRRLDMEDAVSIIPRFVEIPLQMLVDRPPAGLSSRVTHLTGHFFGVYDGHGGAEVADYCKDRVHSALVEEIEIIATDLNDGHRRETREELWTRAFTNCFLKVDDEVGGRGGRAPVAWDTVGSTAVVAVVCSSHIIVANCGDSRAVLCRGREAVALSVDHKPDREDECARIKAAGGRVIDWDGCRVQGVLAMSRSIGDHHMKSLVISDPEVMVVPRARDDECLILASDGLWDKMSNEEACDGARRVLELWYRNNPAILPSERGWGVDPASRAAAEALTHRALQKGSGDNISVVVLDLKRQRRGRSRP